MGTIHARKTSPTPHTCLQTCSIEKQLKHRELKKIVDFLEMNRQGTGDKPLPFMNSLVCSPENQTKYYTLYTVISFFINLKYIKLSVFFIIIKKRQERKSPGGDSGNVLQACCQETSIRKRRFRLAGSQPQAPCGSKHGDLFYNLTTNYSSIKLKEEILLNIVSRKKR